MYSTHRFCGSGFGRHSARQHSFGVSEVAESDVSWGCIIQRLDWGWRVTSKVPHAGGWEAGWATDHKVQLLFTGLHEDPHARQAGWLHP